MKFNRIEVKKIAIDIDEKQQLYVSSSKYNFKFLKLLEKMEFQMNYKEILCQPKHYIYIINTIDKEVFRSSGNVLAQALPQGAKLLDFTDLMKMIDF